MRMKSLLFCASFVLPPLAAGGTEPPEATGDAARSLSASATSLFVSEIGGEIKITSLGTLKNASSDSFENVVLEVKYFDSKGGLIDTVTHPLYGLVAPASGEVAFRVRDEAGRAKEEYASQALRVVAADIREPRKPRSKTTVDYVRDFFYAFGPVVLLIFVWIFFMKRFSSKSSPQSKGVALMERQNAILEAQNRYLERIANAAEARSNPSIPV